MKCRAITRKGEECRLDAVLDGLCMIHFRTRDKLVKEDRLSK